MKIELVRLWASPSTLHLRVIYGADDGSWIKSREIHVPWRELPANTRDMLRMVVEEEHDEDLADDPLF